MNALYHAGPTGTAMNQQDYDAFQQSGQSPMAWMSSHGPQLLLQNSMAVSGAIGGLRVLGSALGEITAGYSEPTEMHHVLPQQFRDFFERAGLNIDEATVELPQSIHQAAHDVGWNEQWQEFFDSNPQATASEIVSQANSRMREYGLDQYVLGVGPYER